VVSSYSAAGPRAFVEFIGLLGAAIN